MNTGKYAKNNGQDLLLDLCAPVSKGKKHIFSILSMYKIHTYYLKMVATRIKEKKK